MSDNISYLLLPKKFHLFHSRTANKPLNCKQIVHFVRSSMPGVSIDLERGQTRPGPAGLVSAPSLSLLRRRKVLLLFIAFVVLVGFTSFNAQQIPGASRSFKWVKDSMRPAQQPQTSPTGLGSSDSDLKGNSRTSGSGTDALRKLAAEQGLDPSSIDPPSIPTGSPPSTSEQILLFLQALSNPSYTVPLLEREWRKQLVPESESDFAASLEQVEIEAASPDLDLKMFKSDRNRWNALHESRHPLTVFSKSYCPYSRRAKALLNSLGATYTVVEVDLREKDSESLHAALSTLSGHRTFPTVFTGSRLLGGFDDLQKLDSLKILAGMLKGAGALQQ
ncbi:unnamed protein product [Jaminaea pallidilutea]